MGESSWACSCSASSSPSAFFLLFFFFFAGTSPFWVDPFSGSGMVQFVRRIHTRVLQKNPLNNHTHRLMLHNCVLYTKIYIYSTLFTSFLYSANWLWRSILIRSIEYRTTKRQYTHIGSPCHMDTYVAACIITRDSCNKHSHDKNL